MCELHQTLLNSPRFTKYQMIEGIYLWIPPGYVNLVDPALFVLGVWILMLACNITYVTWLREWVGCWQYWFWVTGLKTWQILMFYTVFEFHRIVHTSATRCLIEIGFGSKCGISNGQMIYIENQNWILMTCDSFPLIMSHFQGKNVRYRICRGNLLISLWKGFAFTLLYIHIIFYMQIAHAFSWDT